MDGKLEDLLDTTDGVVEVEQRYQRCSQGCDAGPAGPRLGIDATDTGDRCRWSMTQRATSQGPRPGEARWTMRIAGVVDDMRGLGLNDHVCWTYERRADFRARAIEFLAEGLAQGLRVAYVSDGPTPSLWKELSVLTDRDRAAPPGCIQAIPLRAMYDDTNWIVDVAAQIDRYSAATAQALAAGYTGLRVAVDATPLVGTPAQREAFARYEHLLDKYMSAHPFSALCGYDRTALGQEAVSALACVHPAALQGATQFHIYSNDDATIALAGELDIAVQTQFAQALDRTTTPAPNTEMVIDATNLTYIDHRALYSIRDHAARSNAEALLHTKSSLPARLIQLLEIDGIRAEQLVQGRGLRRRRMSAAAKNDYNDCPRANQARSVTADTIASSNDHNQPSTSCTSSPFLRQNYAGFEPGRGHEQER